MTKQNQIYKCGVCGGLLEVLVAGGNDITCCGQKMQLLEEKTNDIGVEKHVPVVEKTKTGIKISVGPIPHPMEEKHYIQFVEVVFNERTYVKFLKPGDAPEAEFDISTDKVIAREHCNIHGLWRN